MKRSLKDVLLNNIGLKIGAVIAAFTLWFIVVNIEDPSTRKSFTLNVTIANEDVLTDAGQYYTIDGSSTIKVSVSAKRSVIEKLTTSDFTATADMNFLMDDGRIPVDITLNRYSSQVTLSTKPLYLTVTVGDLSTKRLTITGLTTGTPATGYVLNSITVSPNVITIEGPDDIVNSIDSVTATCNIDGISDDIRESVVPKFYDSEGAQVDTSSLTMNVTTVDIEVDIQSHKTVDVNVNTSGELGEDLELDSITIDPSSVEIKGEAELLNGISTIEIPESIVDLSQITGEWSTTIDLSTYLPDGATLVDASQAQATITVKLKGENTVSVEVPTSNLSIRNLSDRYSAVFEQDSITIEVTGTEDVIAALDASTITGSVDASGLSEGSSKLPVTLTLPDGVESTTTVTTDITITRKAVTNTTDEEEDDSTSNSSTNSNSTNSNNSSETDEETNTEEE